MDRYEGVAPGMSDQQDSEHFTYERTWSEIEDMLAKAERVKNIHHTKFLNAPNKKDKLYHARNFKALEGVCKTLRWTLGDKDVEHPLD
jgi:hypothetical protein|tara:strand:- start:1687 stop:1950 length:264 start_codon:yes stop_codon:yes gene_type:complete